MNFKAWVAAIFGCFVSWMVPIIIFFDIGQVRCDKETISSWIRETCAKYPPLAVLVVAIPLVPFGLLFGHFWVKRDGMPHSDAVNFAFFSGIILLFLSMMVGGLVFGPRE